jgi:penicillin amidase
MERSRLATPVLAAALALAPLAAQAGSQKLTLPGLEQPVKVLTDELGVPHVYAKSDRDALLAQGYLHARDRFFQMDSDRRAAGGTLAELTGDLTDLPQDAITRMLGLYAAAQRSFDLLEPGELARAQAYADGVNAWLAANPLPPEYDALEVSSVPPWRVLDSLVLSKAVAIGDDQARLWEIDETAAVQSYVDALGEEQAAVLYPGDLGRFAPWVPRATVSDALGAPVEHGRSSSRLRLAGLAGAAADRLRAGPVFEPFVGDARELRGAQRGSNAWGIAGTHSVTGLPLLATDGHPPLTSPSSRYEMHLVVANDPERGPLNVSGMTAPGVPGVNAGQNTRVAWVWTSSYPDAADFFDDRLVRDDPACPARLCIESAGALHPVEERRESYRINDVGDGLPDSFLDFTAAVAQQDRAAVDVLSVPFRSFGPIFEVEDRSVVDGGPGTETRVVTLQYAALHGTREAHGLLAMQRAGDVFELGAATRYWQAPAAHFIAADVEGNLAYFAGSEIPLRADLESGTVAGAPPWLVRDGSGPSNWVPDPGRSQGQTLPFAVLPPEEMPRVVNPPAGFVVNCNEDASGFSLDNDPLNQARPSKPGAIHYVGTPGAGDRALRNGRVTALLREQIAAGQKLSLDDMKRIQGDTRPLHAELLVPHLLAAFAAARRPGAPTPLAALAADARIAEATARLAAWDFSHPSGVPEGYDASDVGGVPEPVVSDAEAQASVAATLYEVWFVKLLRRLNATLTSLGLTPRRPAFTYVWLLSQDPFTGVGSSGVDFFPGSAALSAADRRDLLLLSTFQQALDALSSAAFAAAFGRSTRQDDYRWGRLNRLVLAHHIGGDFDVPPAGGFASLAPGLPGVARDGTWDAVNPGPGFDISLPDGAHGFMGSSGAGFRLLFSPLRASRSGAGMVGWASLTGGASGDPASATYASQLALSLTVEHHPIAMTKRDVRRRAVERERFTPAGRMKSAGVTDTAAE